MSPIRDTPPKIAIPRCSAKRKSFAARDFRASPWQLPGTPRNVRESFRQFPRAWLEITRRTRRPQVQIFGSCQRLNFPSFFPQPANIPLSEPAKSSQRGPMPEPKPSRPYWPDFPSTSADATSGLKPWSWAVERLEKSHNYWIATSRPGGRAHLMLVWGIWWQDAFWFSTGPRTRKAKNIAADPHCVIGTEKAEEAVILEGAAQEITDRAVWKQIVEVYNAKYGGDV